MKAGPDVPRFERDSAFPIELPKNQKIDTGFLVVREDRSRSDSRLIRLPVAILRSSSQQPAPDPVLYLPGGPGGSALNTARYGFAYPFLKHRDFIIFEPRGAKYAEPALLCPEVPAARVEDTVRLGSGLAVKAEIAAARQCREQATASGINPSAYTTEASAADVDDLRRVLGYGQWNLYGVSYGTRLGLAILRQFPGTIRSAVLDSVLPPTVRYDEQSRNNRARSLDLLFRDCEADPRCREAYPNLRSRWQQTVSAASREPLKVTAALDAASGGASDKDARTREVSLSGQALTDVVPLETGSLPELPRVLSGVADGNVTELDRMARSALRPSGYAWGLRYSMWCAEETPFVAPSVARKERLVVTPQVCAAWKVSPVSKNSHLPVVSNVPVLLLSGEYDPETPPAWAAAAAKTLSRAQTITFRGMGHVPSQEWSMPCAMSLADSFLRDPAAPIDQSCVKALTAPPFKTAGQGQK